MADSARALVLGGTAFIGRHLVEALLADGWEVTLFNRGISQPDLFGSLTRLRGDRDGDVSALAAGRWDVVLDVSGYHPDQIVRSGEVLAPRCEHYIYISSISAYADMREPGKREDAPLAKLVGPVPTAVDSESYGPLKALCEQRVAALFDRYTIVRPTIVVGPHDPTDRFTYWVSRLSEPGPHLVPPDLDAAVQFIDVRDLAAWLVLLARSRVTGVFNAAAAPVSSAELFASIAEVTGVTLEPVQLTQSQLDAHHVRSWVDLPLVLPAQEERYRYNFAVDASRAAAAGLECRALRGSVQDTLTWARSRGETSLLVGLSAEREAAIVASHLSQ